MNTIEPIILSPLGGNHISHVCEQAAALAKEKQQAVKFTFNDIAVTVQPGDTSTSAVERWESDREAASKAYREDPQRLIEAQERAEKDRQARALVMIDSSASEIEMERAKVPWPLTEKQLTEYIASLVDRQHDYGTCVYAMSMAATAAFYYVAGKLGVTGFQSSCADMDVIRRTRGIKGPFMLIDGSNALYPQYDLPARLAEAMEQWRPWLKEEARKLLMDSPTAHPDVIAHWKKLAE